MNAEDVFTAVSAQLKARAEWLLVGSTGRSFALLAAEIEPELKHGKFLLGFQDEMSFQTWRVEAFEQKGDEILLTLTRNFQRERQKIRLVPRLSVKESAASVELARLEKANEIAALVIDGTRGAKLVKVALNVENGRLAQIIIENKNAAQIAVLSDVSGAATPENLIASAILWLTRLRNRKTKPVETIWIAAEKKRAKNLQKLRALLRENWRGRMEILEIAPGDAKPQTDESGDLSRATKRLEQLSIDDLWRGKPKKNRPPSIYKISCAAREIVRLAPENIDVVLTERGETVRFAGLPFARVRRVVSGAETVWFGVGGRRQMFGERNAAEFAALLEELKIYRRFDTPTKRHALYHLHPEAWLEAVLRRNVKLLDANLILSPIHNQFRADRDKIDLLALRRDGRLVVIELKTAPDREMIFQAADYWRKVEFLRQKGNLRAAKIFGDLEIADQPALCYLVAPFLSFYPDFDFLAQTVSKRIEMYRFDVNENWRENLKVMRRDRC